MLIWFVTIALLGMWGIAQHPAVLWALNPILGLRYLFEGGITTLLVSRRADAAAAIYSPRVGPSRLPLNPPQKPKLIQDKNLIRLLAVLSGIPAG
jgi:hypothetical protein